MAAYPAWGQIVNPPSPSGGGGTAITSCTGDLGNCTQTGAVLAAQVLSGANIAAGTIPNAALVTAALTAASALDTTKLTVAAIPNGVTATTQAATDNSTKLATTAYADVALTGDVTKPTGSNVTTLANIPTLSGANLTSLNGSNISSGTVAAARGGFGTGTFPGYSSKCSTAAVQTSGVNTLFIRGFQANYPFQISSTGINVRVGTGDASNNSDWGIYFCATPGSGNCTLVDDVGAAHYSTTGNVVQAWLTNAGCTANVTPGGLCTGSGTGTYPTLPAIEPPGYYIFAMTSVASTFTINVCNATADTAWIAANNSFSSSSGGVLPASFASPAVLLSTGNGALFQTF